MASSFIVYDATGISGDYAIPFDYFSTSHLEARVNNTIVGFTVLSPMLIRITPTPTAGSKVSIRRRTPAELVVAPKDFPKLVRFFSEESRDIVFSFDALYGDIFYDVILTASNGDTVPGVLGAVNPNLTLESLESGSTATLNAPAAAPVVFRVDAESVAEVVTTVANIEVATGDLRGTVTVVTPGTEYPSGTIFKIVQVSEGEYTGATLLMRFGRL